MHTYIHLTDATFSEVLTRVSYQLMVIRSRRLAGTHYTRSELLYTLSNDLHAAGFNALSTWVCSCAWECSRKSMLVRDWKARVIARARTAQLNRSLGKPWKSY